MSAFACVGVSTVAKNARQTSSQATDQIMTYLKLNDKHNQLHLFSQRANFKQ